MWACLLCAFISRPLGAPVLFVSQDNPLRKTLSQKTKTQYLQEVSWISQVTTAFARYYTITLFLCVSCVKQWQSGVVLSLCPLSATDLCLEETVLPSYYLYISLIVIGTKLCGCFTTICCRNVHYYLKSSWSCYLNCYWGFRHFGPRWQNSHPFEWAGCCECVYVPLLSRAALPFLLEKKKS